MSSPSSPSPSDDSSLLGLHHVSAITGRAAENLRFYRSVLGLRLVLKTVNQDDPTSYHVFYGDDEGRPGSLLTFFHVPEARTLRPGTGLITATSLRVPSRAALDAWERRLDHFGVDHDGICSCGPWPALRVRDGEGQTLYLVADASAESSGSPASGDGPPAPRPCGLGPSEVTVEEAGPTHAFLTDVLGLSCATPTSDSSRHIYETSGGGADGQIHVVERPGQDRGWLGHGGVHHIALRTPGADALARWRERIAEADLRVTPAIDRHYFHSIYVREPGGILVEIATDTGHAFPVDEAQAGALTLPPKLEPRRASIEANLPAVDDA